MIFRAINFAPIWLARVQEVGPRLRHQRLQGLIQDEVEPQALPVVVVKFVGDLEGQLLRVLVAAVFSI